MASHPLDVFSFIITRGLWPSICDASGLTLSQRFIRLLGWHGVKPAGSAYITRAADPRPVPVMLFRLPDLLRIWRAMEKQGDDAAQMQLPLQP